MPERRKEYDPTKCAWHQDQLVKHEAALFGNGQQGLIKDVASIKTYVKIILSLLVPILLSMLAMAFHLIRL
jgi:hypothetical protein